MSKINDLESPEEVFVHSFNLCKAFLQAQVIQKSADFQEIFKADHKYFHCEEKNGRIWNGKLHSGETKTCGFINLLTMWG